MSKAKENVVYIYVDVENHCEEYAAGSLAPTKRDAAEIWRTEHDSEMTSNGFFLEVILPYIEKSRQKEINKIPTYRV